MYKTLKTGILMVIMALMALPGVAQQTVAVEDLYRPGDLLLNVGAGIPGNYAARIGTAEGITLPVHLSVAYGLHEWFSIGGVLGFATQPVAVNNVAYAGQVYHVGARTSFHATRLIDEATGGEYGLDNIDVYGLFIPGAVIYAATNTDANPRVNAQAALSIGLGAGLRYYLTPKIGVYVEGMAGFQSAVNGGFSFKLKP